MKKLLKSITMLLFICCVACSCTNKASVHSLSVQKLNQKAAEYMQQDKPERAIETLEAIIDLDANYPEAYYNLGVAYHQVEKYPESIAALEKAIELKKDMVPAYFTLGVVYEDYSTQLMDTKKLLSEAEKQKIADTLTRSIDAYNEYLKLNPTAEDKNDVISKIDYLNNTLKKYSTNVSY